MDRFKNMLAGAKRSWVIWLNVLTAAFATIELASGNLTLLFGPQKTADIMLFAGVANVVLRALKTAESLEVKGAAAIAKKRENDPQP